MSKSRKKRAVIALAAVAAILLSAGIACIHTWAATQGKLTARSAEISEEFSDLIARYERSFLLYEQITTQAIAADGDPAAVEAFLKTEDSILSGMDSADFDGIYLYYQGQYLYSWDTPRSVYDSSGYDATTRSWYTGAVEAGGELYFSHPYMSYANDYNLTTISRLLPDGETVFAYDIKLGSIQSFANRLDLYKGALQLIVSEDDIVVGSSDNAYLGGNLSLSAEELSALKAETQANALALAGTDEAEKAAKRASSVAAFQQFSGKSGTFLQQLRAQPQHLLLDRLQNRVGFAFQSGDYFFYILIPFSGLASTLLVIWLLVFLVFLLLGVVSLYHRSRRRSALAMTEKNRQLADAVDAANAASLAKSRFLAQMSHEIRTPMNSIIGLADIAQSLLWDRDEVKACLVKIGSSTRLLSDQINKILDLSAIESGQIEICSESFDLKPLMSGLAVIFFRSAREKGIVFSAQLKNVTCEALVGDAPHISQILTQFLSNAVKFTPSGGQIQLICEELDTSDGKVRLRFTVSDTGQGMSRDTLRQIFEPQEPLTSFNTVNDTGNRLGLSIAQSLARQMNGVLTGTSTAGAGSTFTLELSLEAEDENPAAAQIPDTFRVLIADDEVSGRSCGAILDRLEIPYAYVRSGKEALRHLGEADNCGRAYSLCVIGWSLADMDGAELIQRIHDIFGVDSPAVILASYDPSTARVAGKIARADYIVAKPLFPSAITRAILAISGSQPLSGGESGSYDFSGRRILVAEDVHLNLMITTRLLEMVNARVVGVENGQAALDTFARSESGFFDAILMDINMPIMDGYTASRAIRGLDREDGRTVLIYAMTANAFAGDIQDAHRAGMDVHIAKPLSAELLYQTLQAAFDKKKENSL